MYVSVEFCMRQRKPMEERHFVQVCECARLDATSGRCHLVSIAWRLLVESLLTNAGVWWADSE